MGQRRVDLFLGLMFLLGSVRTFDLLAANRTKYVVYAREHLSFLTGKHGKQETLRIEIITTLQHSSFSSGFVLLLGYIY